MARRLGPAVTTPSRALFAAVLLGLGAPTGAIEGGPPAVLSLEGDLSPIHDPAIIRQGSTYYLFVSFDLCCRGPDSTYKIMVGRSRHVTGRYVDREGTPMMRGGGTLVLEGSEAWRGPGHQAVLLGAEGDHLVFHAYDGTSGRPRLQISTLVWEDGWPRAGRLE